MLTASVLLLAALTCYAALCWMKPFGTCRKCAGTGQRQARKGAKTCRRCRGKRQRLRVGRRLHNAWRRTYSDGTR
ncbi:hypothetical protein ACIQVR_21655 [Streptomyces xanthochromogenes]|uniref:hypothetical protein n=1 Tax=Streptomyces xanthochromogenes TaxID=67384 RepID=UPI003830AEC2